MKFVKKTIPLYYFLILLIISVFTIFNFYQRPVKIVEKVKETDFLQPSMYRESRYKLTKPLLLLDLYNEDPSFAGLKSSIGNIIEQEKSTGQLEAASVYVRRLAVGKWFSINPEVQYSPGSVMKIMVLLTYLREAEQNPEVLNRRIQYEKHFSETPVQKIVTKPLSPNKSYTVNELLSSMIIDSDNDATILLSSNMKLDIYLTLLKDLKFSPFDPNASDYPITVNECSRFFRLLYASTFLTPEMSEYALNLLTKSKFDEGITKSLPHNLDVAHKFGERDLAQKFQLHETAIVYYGDSPYLITVMTRGKNQKVLSKVIDEVSTVVYDYMKNNKS